jgi:hypothetical protein
VKRNFDKRLLALQPYDVDRVLWSRVYAPLALSLFNIVAGYIDDDDDEHAPLDKHKRD